MSRRGAALTAITLAAVGTATPAAAQRTEAFGGLAVGTYREQSSALRFRGLGPAVAFRLGVGQFALALEGVQLDLDPAGDNAQGLEPFTLRQLDSRVAVRVGGIVWVEAGLLQRWMSPGRAGQEVTALRVGASARFTLAPGAELRLRGAYLPALDFSGGGKAPLGLELGFGAAYGTPGGTVQGLVSVDYQRHDRRTSVEGIRFDTPLDLAVLRVGVQARF